MLFIGSISNKGDSKFQNVLVFHADTINCLNWLLGQNILLFSFLAKNTEGIPHVYILEVHLCVFFFFFLAERKLRRLYFPCGVSTSTCIWWNFMWKTGWASSPLATTLGNARDECITWRWREGFCCGHSLCCLWKGKDPLRSLLHTAPAMLNKEKML